jgi:exosortase
MSKPSEVTAGDLLPVSARVPCAMLAIGVAALFFRWFQQQHAFSSSAFEDWGHAYVVPVVSLVIMWANRKGLMQTAASTFWPGLAPFFCGIACYFFFVVGIPNHLGQGLAMILTLAGLSILLLGPAMFRYLFLPIAYLVLGITIPEQIMIKATFPLQAIAAKGAWIMLSLLQGVWGYDVDRVGNTLNITYKGELIPLNVAEQCSGMRMVVAFIALAAALSLQRKHWWQRIALVLLATPVAVLLNVIRVGVLGLASLYSPGLATGSAHMLIGTLLLPPGLALFLGCSWALQKIVQEEPAAGGGK